MTGRLPRTIVVVARAVLPESVRSEAMGDLEEGYRARRRQRGRLAATAWCWRQIGAYVRRRRALSRQATEEGTGLRGLLARTVADLHYALRGVAREPGFTIVATATLALGVGANTAVFSVINGLLLTPLPYADSDRLVRVYQSDRREPTMRDVVSPIDYVDYREALGSFTALAALYTYNEEGFDLTGDGPPRRVAALPVTADYFDVYGVTPALGRPFVHAEETTTARVAILGDGLWRTLTGGDSAILGGSVLLNGEAWEVVGVMPPGFIDVVGGDVDIWVPQTTTPDGRFIVRDNKNLTVVGRLAPGVTREGAQAELDALAARLATEFPESNENRTARIEPLHDDAVGSADTVLWVLLAASGVVLLTGCVNLANLLLGRGVARRPELAIRAALGSGRGRLVAQLLTESLVLAALGGVAGLAVATIATRLMLSMAPVELTLVGEPGLDGRVFGYAIALTGLITCVFGAVPALRSTGGDILGSLRSGNRGTEGRGQVRARSVLVVAEVALALVLLVAAGLLVKSFANLQGRDLGVEPEGVLTFEVRLPDLRYGTGAERDAFQRGLHRRLESLPEIDSAAAISWLPVTGPYNVWGFGVEDPSAEDGMRFHSVDIRVISGDWLRATGARLLRGRNFTAADDAESPRVILMTESGARAAFGDDEALGRAVRIAGRQWEIVGIVDDILRRQHQPATPVVFFHHPHWADNRNWKMFQMVRSEATPEVIVAAVRAQLAQIDPDLVAFNVRTLTTAIDGGVRQARFLMALIASFAVIAGLLAAVGTYGVLSYTVGRRRHEFGIRMALGASIGDVRALVLRQGAVLALGGALLGTLVAVAVMRVLESLLYEVSVTDPAVFAAVGVGVALVAVLATWVPARRATGVEPGSALR